MKIKGLLIALVAAPIIAFVLTQVLWRIYDYAALSTFLSVANFSDLSLGIFGVTWLGIAYKGLKNGKVSKKKTKKAKSTTSLDKEIKIEDVTKNFRPRIKDAVLEFIIIGSGKNLHQIVPFKEDANYQVGEKTYTVNNNSLLIRKPFFGKIKLTAIFREDGSPVKVEGNNSEKVTAEILSLAQRSGALSRTLKEMFSTHLDLKKILFFVVIGIVGVIAFLIISGGL